MSWWVTIKGRVRQRFLILIKYLFFCLFVASYPYALHPFVCLLKDLVLIMGGGPLQNDIGGEKFQKLQNEPPTIKHERVLKNKLFCQIY